MSDISSWLIISVFHFTPAREPASTAGKFGVFMYIECILVDAGKRTEMRCSSVISASGVKKLTSI